MEQVSERQERLLTDAGVTADNFAEKAMDILHYVVEDKELLRAIIIKYILPMAQQPDLSQSH